ncbi:MAG: D-alanyl-D-alanine carboxypeptidase family protein, partial [Saccharofermentanales bacterium]
IRDVFKKKRLNRVSLFIVLFMMPVFMTSQLNAIARNAAVISTSSQSDSTSSSSSSYPDILKNYTLNINADNAIVVEVGRGMQLYLKNPDQKAQIPVASKIMTAVIALESLPLDTKITVSKVAASQSDAYILSLKNGEKYSLEYLLYGLILKDNNAAAIAIAEQISGVEEEFVKLMNTKAISYQMMNTAFTNATGELKDNQLTTVSDVARLVRFGLTNKSFETILKTRDIPFFLSVNQSKHLFNNLEEAWSLVETITGAFQSSSGSQSSFVTTSTSDGINLITIGCNINKNKILNDITTISNSIFEDYEFSTLVKEGQSFPRSLQIGDDVINLQFNEAINYVHPRNTEYIKTTVYEENTVIEYPIRTSEPLARVTFELMDGTKITADLYPNRTIWGESSIYQQLISVYNSNRDVSIIIIISISFLLILGIYHLIRLITKFIRFLVKISKNH